MEEGLAQQMVYGDGKGQTVKYVYAGTLKKKRKTPIKKSCKSKK